ncbi:hypothetical protein RvY_07060 [Ramazzottius varieornatus]|uniref:Uncharacterized protein n=1 Tax=Ramazzottius varieornatus TaxID=947166 RepID=A0A1D1V0R6_RAMVA|nr:hypothetical protein RvY_07060 [Ramazzottius varieornatus]
MPFNILYNLMSEKAHSESETLGCKLGRRYPPTITHSSFQELAFVQIFLDPLHASVEVASLHVVLSRFPAGHGRK